MTLQDDIFEQRKVDVYNWAVTFIRPPIVEEGIRLASPEDIAAFKLDSISSRKEQKDYVDLAVLCDRFSFEEMMNFLRRNPFKDKRTVLTEVLHTEDIEQSDRPEMLIDLTLQQALEKIKNSVEQYTKQIVQKSLGAKKDVDKIRENLIQRKDKRKGKVNPFKSSNEIETKTPIFIVRMEIAKDETEKIYRIAFINASDDELNMISTISDKMKAF